MAYKITDSCVACGSCIGECPVEAISAGDIYVIDADKCIDCGTCAGVCPSEAIVSDIPCYSETIASLGHTPAQVPQSIHLSASIT